MSQKNSNNQDVQTITLDASPSSDVDWKSEASKFAPILSPSQVLDVVAIEEAVSVDGRSPHANASEVHDILRSLADVEKIADKLISNSDPVTLRIPAKDKSTWMYQVTPLGRQLFNSLVALWGFPDSTIKGIQFPPLIELVRTVVNNYSYESAHHGLPSREIYPASELETEDITPRCQAGLLNTIALAIRKKAKAKPFRSAIQHARQETQRAKKSMIAPVVRSLQACKRVLVIREDFLYRNDGGKQPTVEQVAKDLAKLLNNRRHNAIFCHLVGYVWKIEVGLLRGPHIHCIFLFDGNFVQKDDHHSLEIGRYWEEVITEKRGTFEACNAKKRRYRDLGIGMIHVTDVDKLMVLGKIIDYLSKTTQAMRSPGVRSFGTSLAPRAPKSNMGRPSKLIPDVVERLLMGTCSRDEFEKAMHAWQDGGREVANVC